MTHSLITCPACGQSVSSNAAACPGCGEPIRPERTNTGGINMRDPVHVLGVIVALAAAAIFILMICSAFIEM